MRAPSCRNSKEYAVWYDLHRRCASPTHYQFPLYGGRGLTVCARWETFAQFFADMGVCPHGWTLARRSLDQGYDPRNCLWAPPGKFPDARRQPKRFEMEGKTKPLALWCAQYDIPETTVRSRLQAGWPLALALRTPLRKKDLS